MPKIVISVRDKRAAASRDALIVCGNSDYEVEFVFDEEWAAYPVKTARFIWNGQAQDTVFEGDTCPIPVLIGTDICAVGVFAGALRTTTPAYIPAARSITCLGGTPSPPSENVYAQIMALLNEDKVLQQETQRRMSELEEAADLTSGAVTALEADVEALERAAAELDERLDALEQGAAAVGGDVATLQEQVADLMYKPVDITAFSNNASTVEMGRVINEVTLEWAINKVPVALTLDGAEIEPVAAGSLDLVDLGLTGKKTWALLATDERNATDSKTTSVTFVNAAYYGAAAAPAAIDSAFILGLTKKLTDTRKRTITVDAGDGQHIWYAVPVRLGTCTFKVGGFEGGFDLAATLEFTNAHGYTEPYYIYRSGQTGLGSTTVEVS